jgi:hypothetical protein
MTTRRSFITGLISFVAAPAIVRAGNLMQIKGYSFDAEAIAESMIDYAMRQASPPIAQYDQAFMLVFREAHDVLLRYVPVEPWRQR